MAEVQVERKDGQRDRADKCSTWAMDPKRNEMKQHHLKRGH